MRISHVLYQILVTVTALSKYITFALTAMEDNIIQTMLYNLFKAALRQYIRIGLVWLVVSGISNNIHYRWMVMLYFICMGLFHSDCFHYQFKIYMRVTSVREQHSCVYIVSKQQIKLSQKRSNRKLRILNVWIINQTDSHLNFAGPLRQCATTQWRPAIWLTTIRFVKC